MSTRCQESDRLKHAQQLALPLHDVLPQEEAGPDEILDILHDVYHDEDHVTTPTGGETPSLTKLSPGGSGDSDETRASGASPTTPPEEMPAADASHRTLPGSTHLTPLEPTEDDWGARPYTVADMMRLFGLTAAEMATITYRSERTVRRWLAGQNPPKGRAKYRLEMLSHIAYRAEWAVGPDNMELWLRSPNEMIRGVVPLELLMSGRIVELHWVARGWGPTHRHPYFGRRRVPLDPHRDVPVGWDPRVMAEGGLEALRGGATGNE